MERKFKEGDVVVWSGQQPCIGRIREVRALYWSEKLNKYLDSTNTYCIDIFHNAVHEMNLRMADEIEIMILGKRNKTLIPMTKEEIESYVSTLNCIKFPIPRVITFQMKRLGI